MSEEFEYPDSKKLPEQAFPLALTEYGFRDGLTKRELFAAMAMQGILSALSQRPSGTNIIDFIAHDSALAADALIAELEKKK